MKNLLLVFITCSFVLLSHVELSAQCTTTNATSCVCADGSSNCLLLPDITASWKGIADNGWTEYPQTNAGTNYNGQGPDNGRLRVTGSTPNIGHGSFTVRGQDANGKRTFLCGSDTVFNVSASGAFTCPNGYPNPKQLITQRIYQKNGNAMSFVDQYAGSVTYHPAHGHNHVDDWAVMTLRIQTADPNPLNWPIVGTGAKIGFCLMDYGQCGTPGSTYDGHCRDDNTFNLSGNTLHNVDFPNWNLGGGNYNCSVIEQGISSGWTDVYGKYLDGMWINIPPNTCNGDYYIVMEVDKNNLFVEENDSNNYTAVPVTLTMQNPAGSAQLPVITTTNSNNLCTGQVLDLTATAGTAYLWSTGDTTQTITIGQPGNYTVQVTNYCGTNTSLPFTVNSVTPTAPIVTGDTVCISGAMELTANGAGDIYWYDANYNYLWSGNTFTTPVLNTTTTYYVQNTDVYADTVFAEPHTNGIGGGGFVNSDQYEIFNSYLPFTLSSVLVYAQSAGGFTVELQDENGVVLETMNATVPAGSSRVNLNFSVPVANNLRLVGKSITTGGLYRNNNSATYPYDLQNVLSIIGASAGASYFYYFYDWEIQTTNSTCSSAMTPVEAVVSSCASIGENVPFKQSIQIAPNPNNGEFHVNFNTNANGSMDAELINIVGAKVWESTFDYQQGTNKVHIETSNLSKGMYIFNLQYEGKKYPTRLVIE
jgi:hypothetical protein